ncbi:hypothetical protein [Paenibacillus cellulositrophicus]
MDKSREYITKVAMFFLIIVVAVGLVKGAISAFEDFPNRLAKSAHMFN